jgi:hypothetical protein
MKSVRSFLASALMLISVVMVFPIPGAAQKRGVESQVYLPNGYAVDPKRGPTNMGLSDPALIGAIDIHLHVDPDTPTGANNELVRVVSVIQMARVAKESGMRGFVHKTHTSTASAAMALLARQEVPGVEVFGRFAQNFATGGINIAAADQFSQITGGWGRIVEMPTRDSLTSWQGIEQRGKDNRTWMQWLPANSPKYVAVSKDGKLLPEVVDLIAKLATMNTANSNGPLVLATGHATPEEHLLLAREGRKQGLQVLATHPYDIPQLEEIARTGAFIEVTASPMITGKATEKSRSDGSGFTAALKSIHRVGAEHIIISSDCGQKSYPFPTDCLAMAAKGLRSRGVTERELNLMFKENPAKLLGLPPLEPPKPPAAKRKAEHP